MYGVVIGLKISVKTRTICMPSIKAEGGKWGGNYPSNVVSAFILGIQIVLVITDILSPITTPYIHAA